MQETNLYQIKFNKVTQEQYDEMTKTPGEFYFITNAPSLLDGTLTLKDATGTARTFTGIETIDLSAGIAYAVEASNYKAGGTIDTAIQSMSSDIADIQAELPNKLEVSDFDSNTIAQNSDDKLEAIGTKNKNTTNTDVPVVYDWVGHKRDWEQQQIATLHPDWVCYIDDDVVDTLVYKSFRNVGDIFYTIRTDSALNGAVECNGGEYALADYIGEHSIENLLKDGKLPYLSYTDYASEIAAHGSCGKFAWDGEGTTHFKVPTLQDVYIEASNINVAEFGAESLPNIKGALPYHFARKSGEALGVFSDSVWGDAERPNGTSGDSLKAFFPDFDAHNSNSTYQDNAKVKTDRIKYRAMIQLTTGVTDDCTLSVLNKADKDLVNTGRITNCITYIPQDIKLELNNGTLTLKAGSKLYKPNGVNVFDTINIENDLSISSYGTADRPFFIFYDENTDSLLPMSATVTESGTSQPTFSNDGIWYDTTNNKIKYFLNGSFNKENITLPICFCSRAAGVITSIDQIFNGFGYIGSTVFALPGVKGLIPNGRNADGSLKSIKFIVGNVLTNNTFNTNSTFSEARLNINSSGVISIGRNTDIKSYYDERNNIFVRLSDGLYPNSVCVANLMTTSEGIQHYAPVNAFHALDYNDTSYISTQAMPSSKYKDLTLLGSGNTYTAPANGEFIITKVSSAVGQFIQITKDGVLLDKLRASNSNDILVVRSGLIEKGSNIAVNYNFGGNTEYFRFYYCKGEV